MTTDQTAHTGGCEDFHRRGAVGRRTIIGGLGAGLGMSALEIATGEESFASATFGASGSANGNILIVVSLRGGMDGMSVVVPHGDTTYYSARPTIAVPKGALLARDAMFGLNPGLAPLLPMWKAGRLAAIQAAGMPMPNRSHFDAMVVLEDAADQKGRSGWIDRVIGTEQIQRWGDALSTTSPQPASFTGNARTLAASSLGDLQLWGARYGQDEAFGDLRHQQWATLWGDARGRIGQVGREVLEVSQGYGVGTRNLPSATPGYSSSGLGQGLASLSQIIRGGMPLRVGAVDDASWDMHVGLGAVQGLMRERLGDLSSNIAHFFRDIGPAANRVTLVTLSEFGRTTVENGSAGTDHGWGNAVLVAGAGVRGGKYYGRWPGLRDAGKRVIDPSVTTDYRNILADILAARFPEVPLKTVFPTLTRKSLGLMSR